jgi:hypothetical protein
MHEFDDSKMECRLVARHVNKVNFELSNSTLCGCSL